MKNNPTKIEIELIIFQTECDGGDSCCRTANQCGVGQGDCDSDADCNPDLVCGNNNCVGCGFDPQDDCCRSPSKQKDQIG